MTEAADDPDDDETSDFWLWTEVVLAAAVIVLFIGWVMEREWVWGALAAILVVWQGPRAIRAVRELAARRRRPS